jgi:phage FluMu protein Com
MEETRELTKKVFSGEERKPYGRSVRPIVELCARNLSRPMYPLMIHLCYFCQKASSERDFFETNGGRVYIHIQMCPRCTEFNRASQEAAKDVLRKYAERESEEVLTEKNVS